MRERQPKSARCAFIKTRWLCYKNQVEVHFLPNVDGWGGGCRIEKMLSSRELFSIVVYIRENQNRALPGFEPVRKDTSFLLCLRYLSYGL